MNKLNNKGMTIVEVVLTFSLIMVIVIGLLTVMVNYRNKVSVNLERLKLESYKNNLTQDIYNDILKLGVSQIEDFTGTTESGNLCNQEELNSGANSENVSFNRCLVISFQNGQKKALATSNIVDPNDKDSIMNKYIYYDKLKYKLKDSLSIEKPDSRQWIDMQNIRVNDDGILNTNFNILEDGTKAYVYNIDIGISHIDYEEDFGIHIVASNIDISE